MLRIVQGITDTNDCNDNVASFAAVNLSGILERSIIINMDFCIFMSYSYHLHS